MNSPARRLAILLALGAALLVGAPAQAHAATSHLPQAWTRTDEWYNFQTNPRADVHVLASLDDATLQRLVGDYIAKVGVAS